MNRDHDASGLSRQLPGARILPTLLIISLVWIALHTGFAWSQNAGTATTPSAGSPGPADIAGVVTGAAGPEAGVWVIAETSDLPTRFTRIVVTDDHGRYLLPDLPVAN